MIRLRQTAEAGLRQPLLRPLLLIFLGLVLLFVALHTVECGAEGLLFSCALLAAASLRLLAVVLARIRLAAAGRPRRCGRAPPARARRPLPPSRLPPLLAALPLRL